MSEETKVAVDKATCPRCGLEYDPRKSDLAEGGCPICWTLAQPIDEITGRNFAREMGGQLDRTYAIGVMVCGLLVIFALSARFLW